MDTDDEWLPHVGNSQDDGALVARAPVVVPPAGGGASVARAPAGSFGTAVVLRKTRWAVHIPGRADQTEAERCLSAARMRDGKARKRNAAVPV